MGDAIDLNRYQPRGEVTLSYDLDRRGEGGGTPPVSASSDFEIKSTGDVLNPVVGDLLYTENIYISSGGVPPNITLTTYTWKRDGIIIPTMSGATQYMLVADDIGSIISCDVVFAETGGFLQPSISKSLSSVVTGSVGFSIGELQFTWESVWLFTKDKYPLIQSFQEDNPEEVFKVHNVRGVGASWCPPEVANMFIHTDAEGGYSAGTSINGRMFLTEAIDIDGTNLSYIERFQPDSTVSIKLMNKWGTTSRLLEWDRVNSRIKLSGTSTPIGSVNQTDWITLIIRCSDTSFNSRYGDPNIKTEIFIRNTTQDTEYTTTLTSNKVTGMDMENYGWDNNLDISMRTTTAKWKLKALSGHLIDDAEFDNIVNTLDTWL